MQTKNSSDALAKLSLRRLSKKNIEKGPLKLIKQAAPTKEEGREGKLNVAVVAGILIAVCHTIVSFARGA